jgi:hypothetical protein
MSDDLASKTESELDADFESDAATEAEELAAAETVAIMEGTAVLGADNDADSIKASRKKSKTSKKRAGKSSRKTKAKSIRKSEKLTKAGVSGKTSKGSVIRTVASSTLQRRISIAGDISNEPKDVTLLNVGIAKRFILGIKEAKGLKLSNDAKQGVAGSALQSVMTVVKEGRAIALQTIHVRSDVGPDSDRASDTDDKTKVKTVRRPKEKKTKMAKRETRLTDNDADPDNVEVAVGKLSLSIARPKRRASLRISADENDSECDED